jgi:hypothetical protein
MRLITLVLLLLGTTLLSTELKAYQNSLALKAGVGGGSTKAFAQDQSQEKFSHISAASNYGYRFESWEFALSSYAYYGRVGDLSINANQTKAKGSGSIKSVSFGPTVRYYIPIVPESSEGNPWRYYLMGGVAMSLQTLKLKKFYLQSGDFSDNHKVTYSSYGGLLGIGIEEYHLPVIENPLWFEVVYQYVTARKVRVVDSSNYTEIETLSYEEIHQKISGHTLMFIIGMTLF